MRSRQAELISPMAQQGPKGPERISAAICSPGETEEPKAMTDQRVRISVQLCGKIPVIKYYSQCIQLPENCQHNSKKQILPAEVVTGAAQQTCLQN